MYIEPTVLIALVTSLLILLSFLIGSRISHKHQIREIENTLDEVIKGNNSSQLFTKPTSELGSLCLHINRLIDSYRQKQRVSSREENARKQLLSNLSHDVRTPLASVIGYLEAIEKGLPTEQEKTDYLNTAICKAYALKDRVDQLFELVRLDADEVTFRFEPVDIHELTRNSLIDFIPLLEQQNFQVEMDIPDDEFTIITDMAAVTRILQNLIRNALTHGGSGKYLGMRIYIDSGNAFIEVTDHGQGISRTDLPFIFDRLYQGNHSRSTQGGLGLAISKELSQKLGGDVNVISSSDATTFIFSLPISK